VVEDGPRKKGKEMDRIVTTNKGVEKVDEKVDQGKDMEGGDGGERLGRGV